MDKKIGFCCKWIDTSGIDPRASRVLTEQMNQKTTTQKHLASLASVDQFQKIQKLVTHNIETLWRQLAWIAAQPAQMRLFRITSEFLPLYTVPAYKWIYDHYSTQELIVEGLKGIRKYADQNGIRLCSHPGQFTNLCSTRKDVVAASIEDLEYHGYVARCMGYGDTWHSSGFAINIHANVRLDPGLINIRKHIANDVSDTVRNLITLENDEYSCSVRDFIDTGTYQDVAIVLDIHHEWVSSKGKYFSAYTHEAFAINVSWNGQRPLGHFSMPSPDVIPAALLNPHMKPDYTTLTAIKGISSSTLRAHSYGMWNEALLEWACTHFEFMDIEVEAKGKNVASREFYEFAKLHGYIK